MDLNALKIFIRVADMQSFTKAAELVGLTQSGVSRAIARLEQELHVVLLNRNTHTLSLTPDGLFLYESSKHLIHDMEEVGQVLSGRTLFPEGILRITAPSAYGRSVVIPILKDILDRYPGLSVDAVMTDRVVDVVDEGFDAAIRIGSIQDSRLIARTIKTLRFVTVASPAYLARYGRPLTPGELAGHNCLAAQGQRTGRGTRWFYHREGEKQAFDIKGNFIVDTADALLEAALSGMGIVQIMDFALTEHLAQGRLVELLSDYSEPSIPLSLIYAKSRHRSPKISALLTAFGIAL